MRLLLIRHGETEHNAAGRLAGWTDSPLSTEGARQAVRLAEEIARAGPIGTLYTSPLERARRTAAEIAARLRVAPVPVDDLREWHLGACEGLTNGEVDALYPGLRNRGRDPRDMEFCWPGGESRGAFCARVRRAFVEILRERADGTVAVVSHVAVLSTYLAEAVDDAHQGGFGLPLALGCRPAEDAPGQASARRSGQQRCATGTRSSPSWFGSRRRSSPELHRPSGSARRPGDGCA